MGFLQKTATPDASCSWFESQMAAVATAVAMRVTSLLLARLRLDLWQLSSNGSLVTSWREAILEAVTSRDDFVSVRNSLTLLEGA